MKKLLVVLTCVGVGAFLPGCFGTVSIKNVQSSGCPPMATQLTGSGTNVTISWAANHENAVNASGGGYRIYFYQTSGEPLSCAAFVTVPYVSGALAPAQGGLNLASGTWYFRVAGYSALNGGSVGAASSEVSVVVP